MSSVVKVGPHMSNICMGHHFGRVICFRAIDHGFSLVTAMFFLCGHQNYNKNLNNSFLNS